MKLYISNELPSMVKMRPDNDFQLQEIREFLTIKVPGAKYSAKFQSKRWDGTKTFFDRFRFLFPIGFLSRVVKKYPDAEVVDEREYKDIKFRIPEMRWPKGTSMRMYQKEAMLHAFEYKNCLIQAATNAGKSAILAGLVSLLREEGVLIIVHRTELLEQLGTMISDLTGLKVGTITAKGNDIDPYINIAMVLTLLSRVDTDDEVKDVFNRSKVLAVDECHHLTASTHQAAFRRSKAVYRFGFSGTIPDETTFAGWMVRQYIGDVVFNISNKELIEQGVSADPEIYMLKYEHSVDYQGIINDIRVENAEKGKNYSSPWKEREEVHKRVFAKVLERHIVNNENRNRIVVEKVCGEYKDKQTLVVVDYIDQGTMIGKMLEEKIGRDIAFIHGTSEARRGSLIDFRKGDLRVLVSSNIVDEGIDISKIQLLILAGGKKSKRQILQRIGRGLRRKEGENKVHVLDFFDLDGKYLEKHSKERLKIFMKEGFKVEIVGADEPTRDR
jgi:superfamily II DNA or RNA helicase